MLPCTVAVDMRTSWLLCVVICPKFDPNNTSSQVMAAAAGSRDSSYIELRYPEATPGYFGDRFSDSILGNHRWCSDNPRFWSTQGLGKWVQVFHGSS